jgi:hypothetical protein
LLCQRYSDIEMGQSLEMRRSFTFGTIRLSKKCSSLSLIFLVNLSEHEMDMMPGSEGGLQQRPHPLLAAYFTEVVFRIY